MKQARKIAAILLALVVMMVGMSSCAVDPEKAIVNTWEYKFDMSSVFSTLLGEGMEIEEELLIPLLITFEDDGTGTTTIDTDNVNSDDLEAFMSAMVEAMAEAMMAEMGDLGMSEDDIKEYCESMLGEMDTDELLDSMAEETEFTYEIDEDKLFIAADGEEIDEDVYLEFEISGNKLKITEDEGDALGLESMGIELPVEFKKK